MIKFSAVYQVHSKNGSVAASGLSRAQASSYAKSIGGTARATNPLSRVRIKSPSMATGKAPTKRLIKRRTITAKSAKGVFANPLETFLTILPYRIVLKKAKTTMIYAAFRHEASAKEFVDMLKDSNPNTHAVVHKSDYSV